MGLNTENKDKLLNVELFLSSLGKKVKGFVSKHASHNTHGHLQRHLQHSNGVASMTWSIFRQETMNEKPCSWSKRIVMEISKLLCLAFLFPFEKLRLLRYTCLEAFLHYIAKA